ncbi:hypothetical protein F1188_01580 [Roseospira marina]|uniref:DUF922 domain-containing protein n=1 Tax=Roseospira marina TaxID=140057 RepID=A0A5M6IH35_9PROT|nr:hypothetical protein [Roseospira marina]KAA5607482.1 hypothetical protein F1188_01580 [Roseospira marina]MBB4312337.1 hypothetical protein [Roseospira marina]MBB5085647.1 hypothetical protein [Roseospira marina]
MNVMTAWPARSLLGAVGLTALLFLPGGGSTPLLGTATAAAAPTCPGHPQPVEVRFHARFDAARLDHTRGRHTINQMFLKSHGTATPPHGGLGTAVGLTATRSEFRFNTRTQMYRHANGGYCVYLRSVEAHLNQIDTVVYVAREFPKNSCAYDVTYAHEKKHVGIYYFTHKEFAARIETALRRLVLDVNPRLASSREAARTVHATMIEQGLADLLADLDRERTERNAMLDSDESYAREQAKCPSW